MENRPKIKLMLSPIDSKIELAGGILLIAMWSFTLYAFLKLPSTIPTHFNALGQADGWGSKVTLIILPVFATIIYLALTQLNKYPHIFNYLTKITEKNAQQQYIIATRMLRLLKLAILLIFSMINLFTYLTTVGVTNGLGSWFLPLSAALLSLPIIIAIRTSLKKKNNPA